MEQALIYPFLGIIIGLIIIILKRMPGLKMQSKFKKLGPLTGMTKDEIVNTVGDFKTISYLEDHGQICTWQADAYMISIQFDNNGTFTKILTQTVVK